MYYNYIYFLNKVFVQKNIKRCFIKVIDDMDYLTTAEYAEIWKISQRRVAIYCKQGRVEGAVLKGKVWLIPKNMDKPKDPRIIKKMTR